MSMTSREQFEQAIKARFGDSIDYRVCKNSDGEYMAWDMQVAWWAWQAASKASEQQLAVVVAENAGLKQANGIALKIMNDEETMVTSLWASSIQKVEMKTPATDAYLAEVRNQGRIEGINFAASRIAAAYNNGFIDKPLEDVDDVVRAILSAKGELGNNLPEDGLSGEYAEKALVEFAAQLRQGAEQ